MITMLLLSVLLQAASAPPPLTVDLDGSVSLAARGRTRGLGPRADSPSRPGRTSPHRGLPILRIRADVRRLPLDRADRWGVDSRVVFGDSLSQTAHGVPQLRIRPLR